MAVSSGSAEPARSAGLRSILGRSPWFVGVLETVGAVSPPNWWIGAGVIRDVVWEQRFSEAAAEIQTKDVDVAFFDGGDLTRDRDELVESQLVRRRPDVAWDANNQAAVHMWYADRFGGPSPAVRLGARGRGDMARIRSLRRRPAGLEPSDRDLRAARSRRSPRRRLATQSNARHRPGVRATIGAQAASITLARCAGDLLRVQFELRFSHEGRVI
jgi:hypothetical protein